MVKEVGDGFDNFEAIENTFLLPLIIDIYTKNNDEKKQLTFELAFEGMVPIYPDVDASEAFGAQEGIRFFDGNISLESNTKIKYGLYYTYTSDKQRRRNGVIIC